LGLRRQFLLAKFRVICCADGTDGFSQAHTTRIRGMDATSVDRDTARDQDVTRSKSRPGALIWFFRKSRDRWKQKHQALKATVKQHKNRVADVTKSREQWKLKAEVASRRWDSLEAEKVELLTRVSALEQEKKLGPKRFPR
jgi:hypothetical protein